MSQESNDIAYRKEQLRRLQEEVIELEDLKTGVSITDLGLNDCFGKTAWSVSTRCCT